MHVQNAIQKSYTNCRGGGSEGILGMPKKKNNFERWHQEDNNCLSTYEGTCGGPSFRMKIIITKYTYYQFLDMKYSRQIGTISKRLLNTLLNPRDCPVIIYLKML